jgi:hypothetical protein
MFDVIKDDVLIDVGKNNINCPLMSAELNNRMSIDGTIIPYKIFFGIFNAP